MGGKKKNNKKVLVGVLKSVSDLRILLEEKWYRIPVRFFPKKSFTHIAFYQPAVFGKDGKCIKYFGRVSEKETRKRIELLPGEPNHPRANTDYAKITFRNIEALVKPIRNIIPRRVSFGFTDLRALKSANDILQLYDVPPTEQILEHGLNELGIRTISQHTISIRNKTLLRSSGDEILRPAGRTYRLDIAISCLNGKIAVECDNRKAHSTAMQKHKDKQKDKDLKKLGWRVLRFSEPDILEHLNTSSSKVYRLVCSLGGQEQPSDL